ncbi:Methyltransferase domain-containing protein [Nonomuraea solani]|uniref:Methyltransferase domain-containing protein n=1 Tax=Nonomuraea solani TaxID=1144553 RepID=A0A1H6DSG8_9ACTN|nr:class I SAM-dependent methyltransferase [Nonomuraea solani]SEG88199.1 Methyltransferase domain-containing protein [Nonomuraea solani]
MTRSSSYLTTTADAYDAVAVLYAELARDELAQVPLDRALLAAFAEFVQAAGAGAVAELGCGPGRVTAHLRDLGLDIFGVDLSPVMIDLARETYPDLRFEVGSMNALDVADRRAGGAGVRGRVRGGRPDVAGTSRGRAAVPAGPSPLARTGGSVR